MVTITNGEDERRVTRGAFETYFKDIGYEIKSNKVAKPNKIIDNTKAEKVVEQVPEKVEKQPAQQRADERKENNKSIGNNKNKKQED